MKLKIKIDRELRLYIIPCDWRKSYGYSCLGVDNAFNKGTAIAAWLSDHGVAVEFPKLENVGTNRGYSEYEATVKAAKRHHDKTGEECQAELSSQLIGLEGKRIEVVDAYDERRRFYVGKSAGWIPCHLEIARIDSTAGPAVSGEPFQSVRIIPTTSRY